MSACSENGMQALFLPAGYYVRFHIVGRCGEVASHCIFGDLVAMILCNMLCMRRGLKCHIELFGLFFLSMICDGSSSDYYTSVSLFCLSLSSSSLVSSVISPESSTNRFMYSLGWMPNSFLKHALKYLGSLNPMA